MQADYILDYDSLVPNKATKVYLMARFTSGPAPKQTTRRPLNLSLVIDRSGSMAGQKLDFTRQAAQFLVQNLSAEDILSIVLYNDKVETLLMPEKVQRKDAINQRLATIKAGGTTNLSSGWLEGCTLVDRNKDPHYVNRVILMSDGLANRGVTDSSQLVSMAQQKRYDGISTTTMGLGNDFNEDLLMEMATGGGGAFYFIESPEVTPAIFQEELQGLLNVVGQNLTVGILPAQGVELKNQLNAYPMHSDGQFTSFRLGDVFGDEVKALVLELNVPATSQVSTRQIAMLRFEYDELREQDTEHHVIEMPVTLTIGADDVPRLPNPQVQHSVLLLQAAQARRLAVGAADRQEFQTAAIMLRDAAKAIGDLAQHDPRLLEEKNALLQQANQIELSYDMYSRKTMSTQAFYTMNSRHEDTVMLRVREQQKKQQTQEIDQPVSIEPAQSPPQNAPLPPPSVKVEKREGVLPTHVTWRDKTFKLDGDLIRIGRADHNEIVIAAKGVSRFHCQIRRENGQMLLEDLNSTNGTSIGGKSLDRPMALNVGDVAFVCDEKLVFHDEPGYTASFTIIE